MGTGAGTVPGNTFSSSGSQRNRIQNRWGQRSRGGHSGARGHTKREKLGFEWWHVHPAYLSPVKVPMECTANWIQIRKRAISCVASSSVVVRDGLHHKIEEGWRCSSQSTVWGTWGIALNATRMFRKGKGSSVAVAKTILFLYFSIFYYLLIDFLKICN